MTILYDALIVANGDIPSQEHWQDIHYRQLICTDGAAIALPHTITPDIIIGDLDSTVDSIHFATHSALQMHFPHSKILHLADQETTDFEKALNFAQQHSFQKVICMGTMGKSADHAMYNLLLLSRFSKKMQLMYLHYFDQHKQWIFALPENICIHTQINQVISFLPLPKARLTTQGLQWELTDSLITQDGKGAMRNKTTAKTVHITCQGECIAFLTDNLHPLADR